MLVARAGLAARCEISYEVRWQDALSRGIMRMIRRNGGNEHGPGGNGDGVWWRD